MVSTMTNSTNLDAEMRKVLRNIQNKIEIINNDLSDVERIVNDDFTLIIKQYSQNYENSSEDALKGLRERHIPFLRQKKRESLEEAKKRLEELRSEIENSLSDSLAKAAV